MKPMQMLIGKPTANRFIAGEARLVAAKPMLTSSSAVIAGNATRRAPANRSPPAITIAHKDLPSMPSTPGGRVRKLLASSSITCR